MKIYVTGAGGMLGRRVARAARQRGHEAYGWHRSQFDVTDSEQVMHFARMLGPGGVLINCAGSIPLQRHTPSRVVALNALAPHLLAEAVSREGATMIHVSTDCVFRPLPRVSGVLYPESIPDAHDLYGRSKGLGEPIEDAALTVRTSFVGPDHGLWDWLLQHPEGATVPGWDRTMWSGGTVWDVAERLVQIAEIPPDDHVIHLATEAPISKAEALAQMAAALGREDLVIERLADPIQSRALVPWIGYPLSVLPAFTADRIREGIERDTDRSRHPGGA